jgi:hypothetical protein
VYSQVAPQHLPIDLSSFAGSAMQNKPPVGMLRALDSPRWRIVGLRYVLEVMCGVHRWMSPRQFSGVAYLLIPTTLQTGSRDVVTHVVRMGNIFFAFSSALNSKTTTLLGDDIGAHLMKHGDGS